jgi:chemotaxis protein methyltransferase CheR
MIYFDQASRSQLVHTFHRYVKPGGYFFIGHSESIPRLDCPFEYVSPAIYRRASE